MPGNRGLLKLLSLFLLERLVLSFIGASTLERSNYVSNSIRVYAKPTTAAAQERKDEDRRREERKGDVVIGKTSAKAGEKDYALDVAATEQQWMNQASDVERIIFEQTNQGLEHLRMLNLKKADKCFSRVFEVKPNAYLWQAGIVKFYLGDLVGAADILARGAASYETRFFDPASEERIWRYACELKLRSAMRISEKKVAKKHGIPELTPITPHENEEEFLKTEPRKVFRITRELFQASTEDDHSLMILSLARLRPIGGAFEEKIVIDVKKWKLISWFYLGLYYDVLGDEQESKNCMKMALRLSRTTAIGSDLIHTLPTLHMKMRDWFDNDDYEADVRKDIRERIQSKQKQSKSTKGSSKTTVQYQTKDGVVADPVFIESIRTSLFKLRLYDMKESLKRRGLSAIGSKAELREVLYQSLLRDAGLRQP